jgi:hypothetical protein
MPHTLRFDVIGLVAFGRSGESPWLWLIIPALGLASYFFGRYRSRKTGRPMERVGMYTVPFFADLPWWLQASVFAAIGAGLLYHLATVHANTWWWLPEIAAWLGFVSVIVRRKRSG